MITEEHTTRERIILATIECIEQVGIQSVTVRKIADRAGVNVAAINYYFETKEKLIQAALDQTVEAGMSGRLQEVRESGALGPREQLLEFLVVTMDGIHMWPGITVAHLFGPTVRGDYDRPSIRELNSFMKDLTDDLQAVTGAERSSIVLSLIQLFSATVFPMLIPEGFRGFSGLSFADGETRRNYATHLMEHYLPRVSSET
jgi:AcrR family transcriptional regulator